MIAEKLTIKYRASVCVIISYIRMNVTQLNLVICRVSLENRKLIYSLSPYDLFA